MMHWWENPEIDRSKRRGRQGDFVSPQGSTDLVPCPRCGEAKVVYNGNYFCDLWDNGCDWALKHPAETDEDRDFCDLIGLDYS